MTKVTYLAHACFTLENEQGKVLLFDPYNAATGYTVHPTAADVVLVSHGHGDHNNLDMISTPYTLVNTAGITEAEGFKIEGIPTKHDEVNGAKRGDNLVFVVETDGLRVCHLGDLGHHLCEEQLKQIGKVDVLMVPVGGTYTVDAAMAATVCDDIGARIVIPMHYHAQDNAYPIETVEPFVALMQDREYSIRRLHAYTREYEPGNLPRHATVGVYEHKNH
ncbi:MAG: MBL fold metallo-hydrolase [Clostridia bacterium]|nr:MBL fold metallo-hydrolase [Clostridia bacterium]